MNSEYQIRKVGASAFSRIYTTIAYSHGRVLRISPFAKVRRCEFEGRCKIFGNAIIENSSVGYGTYVGWRSEIGNTKIGRFCSIAPNVKILDSTHPSHFVSTHPMFYSSSRQNGFSFVRKNLFDEQPRLDSGYAVEIGSDVWIGNGAIILPKVQIGVGAIIAAGSIVTKNVEPYQIVAGNPAKLIRYRHSPDICNQLLTSTWWARDLNWIRQHADLFLDVSALLDNIANLNLGRETRSVHL